MAGLFAMSLPAISKHLSVLERAGLIECERDGQWRRCVLKLALFKGAHGWLGAYARFWEKSLTRIRVSPDPSAGGILG